MSGLRILLLAPECNPDSLTNPSIGYYEGQALARIHEVTMVLHAESEGAVRRGLRMSAEELNGNRPGVSEPPPGRWTLQPAGGGPEEVRKD